MDDTNNVFELARLAGLRDRLTEVGPHAVVFLLGVAQDAAERDSLGEEVAQEIAWASRGESGGFNSDSEMWAAWSELAAWQEYINGIEHIEKVEQIAYYALGEIAERLVLALAGERED